MKFYRCMVPALFLMTMGCIESPDKEKSAAPDSTIVPEAPVVREVAVQPQQEPAKGQYCYIDKVYTKGDTSYIEADYVQFLMGKEAVAAARKRGDAEPIVTNGDTTYSLPTDYYILNENKKLRTLKLAGNFEFVAVAVSADKKASSTAPITLLKERAKTGLFILTLDKQETVVTIKEQYLP